MHLYAHGMTNVNYVAYPYGSYNANTLTAMANLGMRSGRTILVFNNLSPLTNPFELAQRSIGTATTLDAAKAMVDTAKSRGETLVLLFHDISTAPTSSGWYPDRFRALMDYLISQGVPIITMDDLYRLQSGAITIPRAIGGSCMFTPPQAQYSLTYTAGAGGTLTGVVSQTIPYGGDGTPVTAVANTGYHFSSWSDGSTANPRTDTGVTADVAVTANFIPEQFSLTVNSAHGPVSKNPDQPTYPYNTPVTFTMGAIEPGWTFTGWEGGSCTGTDPCTVNVTADTTVTANFSQNAYTLDVTIVGQGTVAKEPDQPTYHLGDIVTLTAAAADGWSFTGWSTNVVDSKVTINGNTTVTATFTQDEYTLDVTIVGQGTVAKEPDQPTYHLGDIVTLTAAAADGWSFTGWSANVVDSKVTINGNTTVTATFTQDEYTLDVTIVGQGTVTKEPRPDHLPSG